MTRKRVAALIIKEKKILLVKDAKATHIYPPGGSIEKNEGHFETLKRELFEELNVELIDFEFYISFELINSVYNVPQIDYCYFVNISGEPIASTEVIEFNWFSLDEILNGGLEVPKSNLEFLYPKLKKDGFL